LRNAAAAAAVVAAVPESAGGTLDHSATPALVPLEADPYSASTSPLHAPVAQDAPAAAEAAVVVEPGALLRPVLPAVREKPGLCAPDMEGELSSQSPTPRPLANPSCNLPASSPCPISLFSRFPQLVTTEPSTESLQHPVADPGHPANRNPHTSRDSCPRFADRLPRSPPPEVLHSQLRPAHG